MARIFYYLIGFILTVEQVNSSGVFELRLKLFVNGEQKDDLGKCCTRQFDNVHCKGACRPKLRICLKEYQLKIDTTTPCTFGDVTTSLLNWTLQNTIRSQNEFGGDLIRFPFPFTWPGTFSLIVEMWHENLTAHSKVLMTRLTRQRWLKIGEEWTEDIHKSKFSMLQFQYRVTCDDYYYGKGCENLCRPRDDSFGHFTCSPTGDRVCLNGWTGDYCTKPKCSSGCDEQHGHCTKPNECKCQSGWEGQLCNKCQRYPGCMHGTCVKPWDCLCNEGWGGLFCDQDLNFCTNHRPCQNGGTCFNTGQGSYTCNCTSGYIGTNCEKSVDDCSQDVCFNGGTCTIDYNTCVCPQGFYGSQCEFLIETCTNQSCQNNAICTDTELGYECNCILGYHGINCENQTIDCASIPCENTGTCVDLLNGFGCNCSAGFKGTRCEINIDDCLDSPCSNGGTCIDGINAFQCQCLPGFLGPLCQTLLDYCLAKPCANGGSCIKLTNDYECKCIPGFTGKNCSAEISICLPNPCLHGGTCIEHFHDFECSCLEGYYGHLCEDAAANASPSARVSSESQLTTEHVVVIATISTFVPLLVLVAVGAIMCLKQHRKREKAQADEEARLQNEQNTVHSSFSKRGAPIFTDSHIIRNSWGKCGNNALSSSSVSSPDDCTISNISVSDDCFAKPLHQVIDGRSVYTLQRTHSQKQLNTEPLARASVILTAKLQEPEYEHIKHLSVMSNCLAVCENSDSSLLQRPAEIDSSGVYVIEEHYNHPQVIAQALFATEV